MLAHRYTLWRVRPLTALKFRLQDVFGPHDPLVPPRRMQYVGAGDFVATGDEFLGHLTELAGLRPDERVLDAGCGIGRIARPLVGYLDGGSYAGFDVNAPAIGWCQARYPDHFAFTLVDLYNARYHPTGTQRAGTFRFPYADDSFDVALMASVLTHLLEEEADHYLAEARRVLRPGGRLLATFFLLDEGSRTVIAHGDSALRFLDPEQQVAVVSDDAPEEAVAYDEAWVRQRLDVREPIHRGTWRGGEGRSFQDIVVATA